MKLGIGIFSVGVLAASSMYACSGTEQQTDVAESGVAESAMATYVAALSVNGDGSDATDVESANPEPLMVKGCGFHEIAEHVIARFDADANGELDGGERDELVAEFGDAEAGVSAEHPNHGQPGRAAALLLTYDADGSGSLESGELEALQADIQARCEERLSKLLEEFDTNGDGALDDAEWEAARAALRERGAAHRRERFAEIDENGDGTIDARERAALRRQVSEEREAVESEFDGDGDGELSGDERESLRDHLRACVRDDRPMTSTPVPAAPGEGNIGDERGRNPEIGDVPEAPTDTEASEDSTPPQDGTPEGTLPEEAPEGETD